jgi:DNA-binding MarR family transcriptional regulator
VSSLEAIDRLIHEPARLMLMSSLYVVDEADFVNLAARTGFTAGNISSHMAKLEAAGYVEIRKGYADRKPRTTYRLTDAGRRAFEVYRTQVASLLEAQASQV